MSLSEPSQRSTAVFTIQAAADPGLLPSAFGVLAKHGLVPSRWVGNAHDGEERLYLKIEVDGMDDVDAHRLATAFRRIFCVETVVTDQRQNAAKRA